MPGRNTIKLYADESFYHVYNRGVNKRLIFLEDYDYKVFLNLLKRYLDVEPHCNDRGIEYDHLRGKIELLAYCLMPNHVHLLFYVHERQALTRLLSGVMTAYSMYFNKKYKRIGPLFQGRYKASWITNDSYLQHISRYIHLNPKAYTTYPYSSLLDYTGKRQTPWLQSERILELFEGEDYAAFVDDYKDYKQELDNIKHELANY